MPETFMADPRELLGSLAADGNYFVDDPAKLEQLAQAALDRLNARPPDALYVVMSNLPGPGAAALVREAHAGPGGEIPATGRTEDIDVALAAEAAGGACEFVELEDADCRGHGPDIGIEWSAHPNSGTELCGTCGRPADSPYCNVQNTPGCWRTENGVDWLRRAPTRKTGTLHRLGPFAPPATAMAAEVLANEIMRLNARDAVDEGADGYQEVDNVAAWPSKAAIQAALMIRREGGA